MVRVRKRGEDARNFIISHVDGHPSDIARLTSEQFSISRQAANKHLRKLVAGGFLAELGKTKNRTYTLQPLLEYWNWYDIEPAPEEDRVWRDDIAPILGAMPGNVADIWHYAFTEMFNNAIDHSAGTRITVYVEKTAATTEIRIFDDGVGIFRKIQQRFGLEDERHAVLELAKGKLTTDPERHSGEGIFFTSRVVDIFDILSGGVFLAHRFTDAEDWILERDAPEAGTAVTMRLANHTSRTLKKVFNRFTSDDGEYGFDKTVVPVKLAVYGDDKLVSRSQAKRLLARFERFKTVILDFADIESIGQAFADEVFRVFGLAHPQVELVTIHTSEDVRKMISRARTYILDAT